MSSVSWIRSKYIAVGSVVLFVFLWPWLYMISCTTYTYLYWMSPLVTYANPNQTDKDSLIVPPVIHQTWKSKDVPEKWKKAQQSCIELHPDYEYKLWTDADGLKLIEDHYSWFLSTYLSYPYDIQRVDAVRYFILHKYGGIYIDLDMGCLKRLDFLRTANFTAPSTYPIGISNDVMAGAPGNVFLAGALKQLSRWNHWLLIKYIQVMFGTGPMFLTVQYALLPRRLKSSQVTVIPASVYGKYDLSGDPYFYHLHGSSWHADDAVFVFWLDKYKGVLLTLGVVTAFVAGMWAYIRKYRGRIGVQRISSRDQFDVEKTF